MMGRIIQALLLIISILPMLQGQTPNSPPRFVETQYSGTLLENKPVGTNVLQVSAVDNDGDRIVYELGSDAQGKFKINSVTGQITSNTVIDREALSNNRLYFTAYAYDSVTGRAHRVSVPVQLLIQDVNDNKPVFTKTPYRITIKENALGSTGFSATATDADEGRFALIMYTIIAGNQGNKFGIGPYAGTVSVIASVDYETNKNFSLTIKASDGGSLSTETTLEIQIQDVDDLAAVFSPTSYTATVSERASKGVYVTTVTARDGDRSLNAPVVYLIDQVTNPGKAFSIISSTGVITVNNTLNREAVSMYNVRVGAKSTTHKAVFATVTITISDINDNPPRFINAPYQGTVPENSPTGLTVLRVTAQDADAGNNAVFLYSLTGAGGKFTVTSAGYIVVNSNIDRETQDVYNFQVNAQETRTSERHSRTAQVTINVTDVNDNNPRCTQAVYSATVLENQPNGTRVSQISVTDADLGANANVRFSLVPDSSNYYKLFTINPVSGVIKSMATFDREKLGTYSITVRVTDQPNSGQGRIGECTVQVSVGDENDNNPAFVNLPNNTVVSETASVNTPVFSVKASDIDDGVNAAVSYVMTSGNHGNAFAIEPNSGLVTTTKTLDRETIPRYTLGITAKDGRGKLVTSSLVVQLSDVNDNVPVFSRPGGYTFAVKEGGVGLAVGTVQANDRDEGRNAQIVYTLKTVQDHTKFTIGSSSGVIKTAIALDRETIDRLNIRVLARDTGSPQLSAEVSVAINVTDINDHRPRFSHRQYTVTVPERQASRVVLTLVASDADLDTNAALYFFIESGNVANSFTIDHSTGALSTSAPLNREDRESYTLLVTVTDLHGNSTNGIPLRDSAVVLVTVQDVNDNSPVFAKPLYSISIPENVTAGTGIIQIQAQDPDDGLNKKLQYYIVSGNILDRFFIDKSSARIYVRSPLDRDPPRNEGSFTLKIMAKDFGNGSLSSTTTVSITVSDVNDSPPEFGEVTYTVGIPENTTTGTVILRPRCVDRDLGTNGQLSYRITAGNNETPPKFRIDSSNGYLSVSESFDYDVGRKTYSLVLTATDKGQPALSGNTTVVVRLENVNDNSPVFTHNRYTFTARESSYVNNEKIIGRVSASDADSDSSNSPYGRIEYSFLNQSSYYRDHYWLLDKLEGRNIRDIISGTSNGRVVGGAQIVQDPRYGNVTSLSGSEEWIRVGDFENDCISNPALCSDGLTIAFWLRFRGGRYIISSGGQSPFGTGFAFYYVRETGKYTLLLATLNRKWEIVLASIPQTWFYVTFTWNSQSGLRYFENGRYVNFAPSSTSVSRASDAFTVLTVGKPNNIDKLDYYGNLSFSDLLIWKKMLSTEEVLHSYQISRHLTGKPMATAPQYIGAFEINSNSGNIRAIGLLDRESKSNYTLDVAARDMDPVHQRHSSCVVFVEVLDANDNAPVFSKRSYETNMVEHSTSSRTVIKVQATDRDVGTNTRISYSIVSGNTAQAFRIDNITGVITPTKDIDREKIQQYLLGVQARDGGNPSLQATVQVTINIVDINDNTPVITPTSYTASVMENQLPGQSVLRLSVLDSDHAQNGQVTLTVNNNKFTVNDTNGILFTTHVLDREVEPYYQLTITATDKGSSSRSSSINVRVNVLDENDNVPRFRQPLYRAAIVENMTVDSVVIQVSATDPDEGSNGDIAYTLQGGNGIFVINATSGVISVVSVVDREAKPDGYSLIATARDHGYPTPNSASARVNITISDINDNAPKFDKFTYTGIIREDSPLGSVVIVVQATDYDDGLAGHVVYSITGGNPGGLFSILNSSGNITVARLLDREVKATYELIITASDRAGEPKSSSVEVDITITDANDNPPRFVNIPSKTLISELALAGTPVFTVIAADRDIGVNGQVSYAGYSPEGKFTINAQTGVVTTLGKLDYEDVQSYIFYVVAMDQGVPPQNSTTLRLNITVVDANDNNPQFSKTAYMADVSEAAAPGTNVIKVNASERDSGMASVISYNISAGDPQDQFVIHYKTGQITVQKPLDRETKPSYTLLVSAKDSGIPPRFGQASVTIRVTDVNDRPPVFTFSNYQKEIPESTAVGVTVLIVEAVDEDAPANTQLTYNIMTGNSGGHFMITTALTDGKYKGMIKVARPLDRETKGLYFLNISASDGQHTGTARVEILLQDVNDRDPEFNASVSGYTADVAENTPGGLLVIQVTATDRDLGTNAILTYSISGGDGRFTIGRKSGEIRTGSIPLNREVKPVYNLRATATDAGNRQGHVNVLVRVVDKNDNSPVFSPASYTVTLTEGPTTRGVHVTTVNATDADEGTNRIVEYSITAGNIGNVFHIDNNTGEIRTAKTLDREAVGISEDNQGRGVYRLTVRASDHGTPPQYSTVLVTVQLLDINDNAPVFPPNGYSTMISEGAKANQDVIAAKAVDKDAGENKRLTYELIAGNTGGDFTLDPDTAMIKTARNLERRQTFSYNLTIGAADHGRPSFSATTRVAIVVGDLNDNNPVFRPVNYSVSVYENTPVGTPLVDVTATDADTGQNSYITYTVTAGDPLKVFSTVTKARHGTLTVAHHLDREVKDNYNLTITATDGGVPISRKAVATVLVKILDRNDNSPRFSHSIYTGSIVENSGTGQVVNMVNAIFTTDRDVGVNADIRYHLNGTESSQFTIDPRTGVITTRLSSPPTLDHELITNYTFHVVAVDKMGTGHASFAEVKIQVLDANDNIPRFVPRSKTVSISEAVPAGHSVTRVTATDPDSGLNGRIFYSINSGSEGKFEVGRADGVIRVSAALDREAKAVYMLNVSAIDGSYYPKEGYGTVIVQLQDVNDNAPRFIKPMFNVEISEGAPVGVIIVNATAKDPDYGTNSVLTYSMSHPKFVINANTGAVSTTALLDRETKQTYSFTVQARDGGGLESSVSVNVLIRDENDNSPQFPTVQYQTDVIDKTPVGTIILDVNGEDRDTGNNGLLTYSIVDSKDTLFRINAKNGLIAVNKVINRLQLTQAGFLNPNGSFIFKVEARDQGTSPRSTNVTVVINIVDSGDDSPVFNKSSYVVNIQENQPPGTQIVRLRVIKQRPGTTLTYSIVSSQSAFTIDRNTGVITTALRLDRESRENYVFTAQATDNGQTPRSGYTSVVVQVTDANDNAPEFQFPAPYKMTVNENAALGTDVGRVKALDLDQGINGQFEYAITHANIGPGLKMVSINKACATPLGMANGDVRASDITATSSYTVPNEDYSPTQGRLNNMPFNLAGVSFKGAWCAGSNNEQQYLQLDFRGMRKVTRIATQGRPASSDYVGSYTVSSSQDGVKYSQHRLSFVGNTDANSIRENRILPGFHARYVRVHPKSWIGRICMRIELYGCESTGKDEVILPFIIMPETGNINTSAKLDREQQSMYKLIVQAKDKGNPSLNSTTRVEISITDTNDNRPQFTRGVYFAFVPENAYGGYQVIRVSATDADIGSNAQLTYDIVSGGDGKFIIEATSGIVRPSGRLDFESMAVKYYVLNVSVTDHGLPQFSSTALLNISVTDFNDNIPVFNSSSYTATVSEDVQINTGIYTITASDADSGINAQISYSLVGGDNTFLIIPGTGEIRLQRPINRETKDIYHVTVTASDRGTPVLTSQAQVAIRVLDVNDNPPVFTSRIYARTMSEGVAVGTISQIVHANDADIALNGQVRYQITDGNSGGLFTIDAVTGAIRLAKRLDRETNATIKLTVLAKDQGIPQLSDQAVVRIELTDVNDNAPVIRPRNMTGSVVENALQGAFVLQVNATDSDIHYNGRVSYAIMHGGDGRFTINSTTGVIRTVGSLNREAKDLYTLIVMARDKGTVPYMDFGTVDVHVLDMNDNTPVFITSFGPFSVTENQVAGTKVGLVSAGDQDIGSNAAITYSIAGGDQVGDFTVNSRTGIISTAKTLDRERKSHYDLTIAATNLDTSPTLSSSTVVRVKVLDKNDEVPEFISVSYNQTISEASPPATSVVKVSALDKDEGTNSRVLYRIRHKMSSSNSDVFTINAETGVMTLQVYIDEYEYRKFTIIVEAKDMGSPQALSSNVPVYVTIDDINDNQPVFTNKLYSVSSSEDTAVGQSIVQISATDADTGINGKLTYTVVSGDEQNHFRINSSTGVIFVNSAIDRETRASYRLVVGAFNNEVLAFNNTSRQRKRSIDATGHLYDTTVVNINLVDINDNAPKFVRPLFVGGVPEGAELKTYIMTITARDADIGNFSAVSYRILSGNEGGFFRMDPTTGVITSASLFQGKKGQRFTLKITAYDNNGRQPYNEARESTLVRIFVLLEEQRITLKAEVDPSLIEENKNEFLSVLHNITEAEVYIEQIFKVYSVDKNGDKTVNSEVVFHAVKESNQLILTNKEVLRTIDRHRSQLETMYAKWKIKAVKPSPEGGTESSGLNNAELALIILGSVIGLALLIGMCFAFKTRCSYKKQEMYNAPPASTKRRRGESWSYYDDVVTNIDDKAGVAAVRIHSDRGSSFNSDVRPGDNVFSNSGYLLSKKRLSQNGEDKMWSEGDYYLSQDSKMDSYLDDDGESDGANRSDVSQPSTSRSQKTAVMTTDGMPVTKV